MWFQQNGAKAHTAREGMQLLWKCLNGKIISRFGDINRPSCPPDLTSPDFFLWGYLKEKVFVNKLQSLIELKKNITREIRPETLGKVMAEVIKRAQTCEAENERHMQDVIFHI